MARLVTVNGNSIALPDGQIYNEGETATLSDEQFARISSAMFAGGSPLLTDDGYEGDLVVNSPDGTPFRILVANDGTLSTEEVV